MTATPSRRAGILVILTAAALAACKGKESGGGADTGTAAGRMAPAPAAANTTTTAASAPSAGAPALTDANIVYILDQANAADSAQGRLAETKGTSADVKSFGRLMVGEHHALRAEGQQLAKKLGVTPEKPAGDRSEAQAKQELDSLTALPKGPAWDRAYIDYEVGYHQAVLRTATNALGAAQNPQLKELIRKAAPVLQHHLDRAQQIQKKLTA